MNELIEKIKKPDNFNFYYMQSIRGEDGIEHIRKEKARYFVTQDGRIARYARRLHKRGYAIDDLSRIIVEDKKRIKTPEQKWNESWFKVSKRLEKSGLYEDLLKNVHLGLEIGYEKIQLAYNLYWEDDKNLSYVENQKRRDEEIKNLDERLLIDSHPNTEIIWYMKYPAKVKKMNFGKPRWDDGSTNKEKLQLIAKALKEKKEVSVGGRNGYDISFSYNPKINKAWYSEEYRGCGNGHYYLALDATHALFYEDD
ncbi:MAG: hypothetical protein WC346_03610 [Methanogenium sp.]|jgi:hypothetical protein